MKILLTNDDGYGEAGLECLKQTLSKNHQVWVVAPDKNKSGTSCSFTFGNLPLYKKAENEYSLEGTPVDCVISAVNGGYLPDRPDIIISGINAGYNLGTDIIYSGTCAAARQASLLKIPGIAVSTGFPDDDPLNKDKIEYTGIADFIAQNISILKNFDFINTFLNINSKSKKDVNKFNGIKITDLSKRDYPNKIILDKKDNDFTSCMVGGKVSSEGSEFCDVFTADKDFISISAVCTQPSCANDTLNDMLKELEL